MSRHALPGFPESGWDAQPASGPSGAATAAAAAAGAPAGPREAGTATAAESAELAVLERSGFIESRHIGSAVVLDRRGEVLSSFGSPDLPVYPRSCLKPFQAVAVLETGVDLDPVQSVLAMASHAGTSAHVEVVESILAKAKLGADALGCPPDWPGSGAARDTVIRAFGTKERVYMNCSGKHAAMLLACVENFWPVESYLEPEHPLQQRVKATVERWTGENIRHSGVDGCGAPVHAISLTALARGIGRLRRAESGAARRLTDSVLANGWALDGPGRANTVVIDRLGVLAKLGAEGVMVMATPDGVSVAVKMLDGSLRAATLVALTLLARHGAVTESQLASLLPDLDLTVYGGTAPVGTLRVSPALAL